MIVETTNKLARNANLSYDEMHSAMDEILGGKCSVQETVDFLKKLTAKGESYDEVLAMLDTMQEHAIHIKPECTGKIIDVCGTGGDKLSTFNVSTTASFVIAAGGGYVAKHGNRSTSGISGSADIFEYFGYDLNMEPSRVKEIIEKFHIGFMFAQKFHPMMKNVAAARKALATRTAFNLLGPLINPAKVRNQLVGVSLPSHLQLVTTLLQSRGSENVMAVISEDGLDELSTTAKNKIYHLQGDKIRSYVLDPSDLGLERSCLSDIQVTSKEDAIRSFISILNDTGKKSMIDITALNAAAGFIVCGISEKFDDALDLAFEVIHGGKAFDLFRNLIKYCGNISKVEELIKN